jgi:hypothetical protein
MSKLMWGAALLMALTTGVHLFMGTSEIMGPIQVVDLELVIKSTAMVVWHGVTLILVLSTFGIAFLARHKNQNLALFIVAIQFGFVRLFLFYTLTVFGGLFALPQWTVFLLVAALMSASIYKDAQS